MYVLLERRIMNGHLKSLIGAVALSGALLAPIKIQARQDATPAPDNSKMNKRDRSTVEPTADQAKNNLSDREVMREIRNAVVSDKSLSTYGHNVKIISQHGKVTLKGPVNSDDEKHVIEQHARKVAGDENVTNELTVKHERSN